MEPHDNHKSQMGWSVSSSKVCSMIRGANILLLGFICVVTIQNFNDLKQNSFCLKQNIYIQYLMKNLKGSNKSTSEIGNAFRFDVIQS